MAGECKRNCIKLRMEKARKAKAEKARENEEKKLKRNEIAKECLVKARIALRGFFILNCKFEQN